ncbi:P-selectin-like [Leucoraja erinacea]|uniref:P-selectin-like n=1 Tax=Leucoraja erinaceus TaxID=7782 RepID=UPI0024544E20|nr:P-selectin-like [Leucoraja erinacea]
MLRYKMVGRASRRCVVTGWDGQVPTCEAVKCPDLKATQNGITPTADGEFWETGMVAEYRCNADYSLIGSRLLECKANGHWNHKPPTCKIVRCTRPATPENAVIQAGFLFTYKLHGEVTYRCKEGYVMIGPRTIRCTANNDFVPSPPTCRSRADVILTTKGPDPGLGTDPTHTPGSQAGRNVGQWYGLLIILVYSHDEL